MLVGKLVGENDRNMLFTIERMGDDITLPKNGFKKVKKIEQKFDLEDCFDPSVV